MKRARADIRIGHLGVLCIFALCLSIILSSCLSPSYLSQEKGSKSDVLYRVNQAYIDARNGLLRADIEKAVAIAEQLAELEDQIEETCQLTEGESYQALLEENQEQLRQFIEENSTTLSEIRDHVAQGHKWVAARVANSEQAQKAASSLLEQLSMAESGLADIEELMAFEQDILSVRQSLGGPPVNPERSQVEAYYEDTWGAYGQYSSIDSVQCMADLHERTCELWKMVGTYFYNETLVNNSSELDRRSLIQLIDWFSGREKQILRQQAWVAANQYRFAIDLMTHKVDAGSSPQAQFRAIERISPNLYQTLDSVLDLTVSSTHEQEAVLELEIAGLTLAHTTKLTLLPGLNYFELKPELLPSLSREDLENTFTTQLNFKISTPDGTVIDQQSAKVEVLSLFDYLWYNDEFGFAAQYELFAWLRPGTSVIDDLNRRAANYMGQWTDGLFAEINGYQYGQDWYGTLLQVAAIQKAFSDSDIAYIIDTYTPTADQRVLTPAEVFERKQALCIESSLVMASALLSAGMHPMIIITPGHAQVAVETWADSGQYFLIETTELPYSGLDRSLDSNTAWAYAGLVPVYNDGGGNFSWVESLGSSETWQRYFNWVEDPETDTYGGIFVLDCSLQRIFGIHGLDGM